MFQVKPFLQAYLDKTLDVRGETSRLFISLNKPFADIVSTTDRNIFIAAMNSADIDTSKFKPHSSRSSSTAVPGLTLHQILAMGCWRAASTYYRYYDAEQM